MINVARTALLLCAASAMFGTASGTVLADGNTGSIYGRVYTKGSHHPACCVVVRVESTTEAPQETLTKPDGSFSFAAVFPGTVIVTIGKETTPIDVHANLESDETIYVNDAVVANSR
jgi:hypothetical protein